MKLIKYILFISLMMFLSGCGDSGGSNVTVKDTGSIEGVVSDSFSTLSGVSVTIDGKIATSNTNGVYTISDIEVDSRTITATKSGYNTYTTTVSIEKGTTVNHNILLTSSSNQENNDSNESNENSSLVWDSSNWNDSNWQ